MGQISPLSQRPHQKKYIDIPIPCLNICKKNALKIILKNLLYSKKTVIIPGNEDRRNHSNYNEVFRTDDNLQDREDKFAVQIDSKYVYTIPLKYLCDLGKINFSTKIDLKICCTL